MILSILGIMSLLILEDLRLKIICSSPPFLHGDGVLAYIAFPREHARTTESLSAIPSMQHK